MHRIYADRYGVSVADITTGDYFVTEFTDSGKLMDEIFRFAPSEIICNEAFYMSGMDLDGMKDRLGIRSTPWMPGILMMRYAGRSFWIISKYRLSRVWDWRTMTAALSAPARFFSICWRHRKMICPI